MKITSVSSKGQITIPKEIQEKIGVKPRSKVMLYSGKGTLTVKPLKTSVVDEVAGSLNPYIHPSKLGKSFDEIMEETKKIVARKLAENR